MKIICCYTNQTLTPEALTSFGVYFPAVEMINVSGDWTSRNDIIESQTLLWRAIKQRWTGEHDLILLSDHEEIDHTTLEGFRLCHNMVCYWKDSVRYSRELQRKVLPGDIGGEYFAWHLLDSRIALLLSLHQIEVCRHK